MNIHTNPADLPHCVNAGPAAVDQADIRRALAQTLLSLTPIEERIVRLRFGIATHERLMSEISAELGIGASTVDSRLKTAMRKLIHPSRSRRYRSCIMDGIEVETDMHDEVLRLVARE